MDKPTLITKYHITEGRYLKNQHTPEEISAKLSDTSMRDTVDFEEVTEWRQNQMINLDEVRDYNPTEKYGGMHTVVKFNNGDEVVINQTPIVFLDALIAREEFLYKHNHFLGSLKFGKNG